jgi:5-methylcytosine-specific restriction endonuclease McrA
MKRSQIKKDTGQYSGQYRKRAAEVRASALVCHLCGEGARLADPWVADHINPASHGNTAELKPAHRSCNGRRGNKPL